MDTLISNALTETYTCGKHSLSPLGTGVKHVFRVHRPGQDDWILRAFPNNPDGYLARNANDLARMLLYLEKHGYRTERVVHSSDGMPIAQLEEWELLVTTDVGQSIHAWVAEIGTHERLGEEVVPPETWSKLGVALGQLHTIPIEQAAKLPKAGMLPARELTWLQQFVDEISEEVPPQLCPWYDELRTAISNSHHCEDLERVLIHCDPNLGNAAMNEAGEVVFIDWDVVGLGPAVFDLGSMLCNCVTHDLEPDEAAIQAVMTGYLKVRSVSTVESKRLDHTVSSQMLVTLGGYLPALIRGEIGEDEPIYGLTYAQWQAKYRASSQVAAIAQAYCTF